jgi:hypothetical protein
MTLRGFDTLRIFPGNPPELTLHNRSVSALKRRRNMKTKPNPFISSSCNGLAFAALAATLSALTLSGNNTNAGGVNLTAGMLKLGSTTALGAAASTLTISGGTIFDITKLGAGTLVYGGNTAMTGAKTVNATAGTLALTGNVTGGHGITVNGAVTLSLRGATGTAAASAITANSGSVLIFDSSSSGVVGTTRADSVSLKGASLNVLGNSTAHSVDTIDGPVTVDSISSTGSLSLNVVTLTPGAGANIRLDAGSLARANQGTVLFRGAGLGVNALSSPTADSSNIAFDPAPTLSAAPITLGTKTAGILPWAVISRS